MQLIHTGVSVDPLLAAEHANRLGSLQEGAHQQDKDLSLESDLKQIRLRIDELFSHLGEHLDVELVVIFTFEALLFEHFESLFHIGYQ